MRKGVLISIALAIALLCAFVTYRSTKQPVAMAPVVGRFSINDRVVPAVGARSAGCSKHESSPLGRAFAVGGRGFYVWGPRLEDGRAYPIVLAFHGWGSNGRGFQKWFEMEKYVDDAAFVVYPDAASSNWDYSGTLDIDFVAAIIETMKATYCVDETRVMALGFSYGSRFVNHLGCARPSLVRGIVPSGGSWDREPSCKGPLAVLVAHRTHDPTMRIEGGHDAAERWAKIDGCHESVPVDHGCIAWKNCESGAVSFCEDPHFDPEWPPHWNHTMREEYRLLAWRWFASLR